MFDEDGNFWDDEKRRAEHEFDELGRRPLTPTEFLNEVNYDLEEGFSGVEIEGEVASFKVSQGKWVFFDLKDNESSVNCFLPAWNLRMEIEDGMKIVVTGAAKVTKWGKFSLTVSKMRPVGEGSLKKAYELLKKKLAAEGLFLPEKKRKIPRNLERIGVISSTQAAGYADFIKILNARFGGMKVFVAHTQVQGDAAPDQIIRALNFFNEKSRGFNESDKSFNENSKNFNENDESFNESGNFLNEGGVQVIVILRGGGSADDLMAFNDEKLVRAIAASKIPVVTGIGHEVDETLADLAADLRASTPSNAAELISRDRKAESARTQREILEVKREILGEIANFREQNLAKVGKVKQSLVSQYIEPNLRKTREGILAVRRGLLAKYIEPNLKATEEKMLAVKRGMLAKYVEPEMKRIGEKLRGILMKIQSKYNEAENSLRQKMKILEISNPEKVLAQGYAILVGKISPGNVVKITTSTEEILAKIQEIKQRAGDN